jgi:AcrR family transcriptional regulator
MPRIEAATVAEHHRMRRQALLAAGAEAIAEQGVERLRLADVGARAGLARSSVYQYFDSASALVAAVVEDAFPRVTARLEAVAAAVPDDPRARLEAYLDEALVLARDPVLAALPEMLTADLPEPCRARVAQLHAAQAQPLVDALRELGVDDVEVVTGLLVGVLHQAGALMARGVPAERVRAATLALARGALP